ncbi:MAG TPA: zinc dependent phospholipase C family protein [Bryobacteraceae bacterium]|nr:zinc dependent phospholipase C family protein [Bryobacteraceae bacterium]
MAALGLVALHSAWGYGVYSHGELIDVVWDESIRPLLLQRYPGITEADLTRAHSYAYGGCTIQDLGYYPFGSQFFSNLTHYVRSGDFVAALVREASNADELAFAIGALSHYIGDIYGHSQAVNLSVPQAFPRLASRYGEVITFEQAEIAHGRVETGFDMAQIGLRRFAPVYRSAIGFRVAQDLLDRAFRQTYALSVRSVIGREQRALNIYRFSVRRLLPKFMQVQVLINRNRFPREKDTSTRHEFLDNLQQAKYAGKPRRAYWEPGVGTHALALLVRVVPKVGTLKILSLKAPSPETNDLYFYSVNTSVRRMRELAEWLRRNPPEDFGLANVDLDTGKRTEPGTYRLTDDTYARLLNEITTQPGTQIPQGLRDDILLFYSHPGAPISTKSDRRAWARVMNELNQLKVSAAP